MIAHFTFKNKFVFDDTALTLLKALNVRKAFSREFLPRLSHMLSVLCRSYDKETHQLPSDPYKQSYRNLRTLAFSIPLEQSHLVL